MGAAAATQIERSGWVGALLFGIFLGGDPAFWGGLKEKTVKKPIEETLLVGGGGLF